MRKRIEQLETDRLIAERVRPEHLRDICRLHSDPEVMRTLSVDGNVLSGEATQQGLVKAIQHWDRNGFGLWVFRAQTDGAFIGRAGLQKYQIEGSEVIGLAYAVVSDYWGRGYATEMSDASLQAGFGMIGAKEISTWTLPENKRSQRVMEKLGFLYSHDFLFAGLLHRFYRITPNEFQPGITVRKKLCRIWRLKRSYSDETRRDEKQSQRTCAEGETEIVVDQI